MIKVARVEYFKRVVEQMLQKSMLLLVIIPSAVAGNIFRRNCSKPD